MLIAFSDTIRRGRVLLVILALASVIGIGAAATHGALDASSPATSAHDHADTCLLVGLVCALVLATAASFRTALPRPLERLLGRSRDGQLRPAWSARAAAALAPEPSPPRLCRFLT